MNSIKGNLVVCFNELGSLRAIPTLSLYPQATDCRAMVIAGRSVSSEISNMLDVSRRSPSLLANLVAQ